jgi:hypothetical protein
VIGIVRNCTHVPDKYDQLEYNCFYKTIRFSSSGSLSFPAETINFTFQNVSKRKLLLAVCQYCGLSTQQISLSCHEKIVEPSSNGNASDGNVFRYMKFPFYTHTWISIKDSPDGKIFPLNTRFRSIPVSFKTSFAAFTKFYLNTEQIDALLTFWLRDASTSLTFNNCTLCPHCIYVLCKQRLVPLTA